MEVYVVIETVLSGEVLSILGVYRDSAKARNEMLQFYETHKGHKSNADTGARSETFECYEHNSRVEIHTAYLEG